MDQQFTNIEIYHDGTGDNVFIQHRSTNKVMVFDSSMTDFIDTMFQLIKERYSEAFAHMLDMVPAKHPQCKYIVVRRFLRCNFFINDSKADIDENGILNLEIVPCPLRGGHDCNAENIICRPKLNTVLSDRELQVARELLKYNNDKCIVANTLFLSEHTVHNHRTNIYAKLGVNNISGLAAYMQQNDLLK